MKRTSLILLIVLTLALLLETFSLAWVSDNGLSSIINVSGNVHKNYFAYGKGTKDEPYGIANPVQLYYFSWLQYLGFFNNTDNDGDGYLDSFYFEIDPELEGGLDMKGYKLPPIGTTDNPFIGNFNGHGKTISNLTVRNYYNVLSAPPSGTDDFGGAEIIGFFGVIGSLPNPNYKYHTQENEVKNLALKDFTIITQTNQTLVGIVAGYVNGLVDCVGVIGGNVQILSNVTGALTEYTNNLSDYSLIGHCTAEYKDSVYVMDVTISQPGISGIYNVVPDMTSDGEGHGWGGSVKMYDIFTWLTSVSDTAQQNDNTNYYVSRTDVVDIGGKRVTVTGDKASKPSLSINTSDSEHKFGTFVFGYDKVSMNGMEVNFVGGSQRVTKYEYKSAESDSPISLYHVIVDERYLVFNGSTVEYSNSEDDATEWYVTDINGENIIFTVYNNAVYYLTESLSVSSAVNVDHENLPTFNGSNNTYTIDGGMRISATSGGTTYYMDNNGTTGIQRTDNVNDAAIWFINEVDGGWTISTIINGTPYYLRHQSSNYGFGAPSFNLSDTLNADTTWERQANGTFSCTTTGYWSRTYYLRYNNNFTLVENNGGTALTYTDLPDTTISINKSGETNTRIGFTKNVYVDDSAMNRYYDENGEEKPTGVGISYFPLSSNVSGDSYNPSSGNTGYIVGAGWGAVDSSSTELTKDNEDSNIRISEYSNNNNGTNRISNISTPYTMTFNNYTSGAFEQAPQLPTDESPLTTNQKQELARLGFVKYANCYSDLTSSIVNNNCYGLHFMNTAVSAYTTTKIDAYLNGEWIPNYEVPLNCIDFNLYERGFINFLAGSYYSQNNSTNNSFFSIYQILRDGTEIDEIKEIYKIYGTVTNNQIDTSKAYVYTYVAYDANGNKYEVDAEGNRVTNGISGLTMIFDCDWITNPTAYISSNQFNNKAYYFEVPVNEGEYAIGSTKGKTGAYLIYLDLAANAQIIERQKDYEKIVEEKEAGSLPHGVELLAPGETIENGVDPSSSAFVSINKVGDIIFSTTDGVTITHTAKDGTSAEYIGPGVTLKDGNDNVMQMQSEKTVIEQTTYRDRNLNTGEYTVTVITKTTVGSNVTYARTITKGTWNSETNSPENMVLEESIEPQAAILGPKTADSEENEGGGAVGVDSFIKLYYSYGQSVNLTVKYEYTYSESNPTYNITVTHDGAKDVSIKAVLTSAGVSSNLTFYINGQVLNDTVDPQTVTVSGTPAEG